MFLSAFNLIYLEWNGNTVWKRGCPTCCLSEGTTISGLHTGPSEHLLYWASDNNTSNTDTHWTAVSHIWYLEGRITSNKHRNQYLITAFRRKLILMYTTIYLLELWIQFNRVLSNCILLKCMLPIKHRVIIDF